MALNIVKDIDARVAVRHVLMSVSDKTGLDTFVPALVKACPGVKIYSTGGTYAKVLEQGVAFGASFPQDEDLAHQANEYADIEGLYKNIKIFALAIVKLAGKA